MSAHHSPSQLIRNILEHCDARGTDRLVLLILCEYSSWSNITASNLDLMQRGRLSERQVRKALKSLVAMGHLTVNKKGNGRGNATEYHINVTPYF